MIEINELADVKTSNIGDGTRIWQFCVIFSCAKIGKNCNICANVLIEDKVIIGDDVTIKSGVQIWDGVTIENKVFIGPNVTFTNDLIPRSKQSFAQCKIIVGEGASIGANSTIIAGNDIGKYSFIGAGSVVTKDIPNNTVWYGNPAKFQGYITDDGLILDMNKKDKKGFIHKI